MSSFFVYKWKVSNSRYFTSVPRNRHDYLRIKPEHHPHPSKTPINAPFQRYLHLIKDTRKGKKKKKKGLEVTFGDRSWDFSHSRPRNNQLYQSLPPKNKWKRWSSAVQSLPDPVGIVFPKIKWCSLTWSFFSLSFLLNEEDIDTSLKSASCSPNYDQLCPTHTNRPALTNVSSYFKRFIISFCHFRNVHTEYVEPRKSLQVDSPRSEKEIFVEGIGTPCLLRVQSRRTGPEIQSHAYSYAVTVFQIDNWAKSLSYN